MKQIHKYLFVKLFMELVRNSHRVSNCQFIDRAIEIRVIVDLTKNFTSRMQISLMNDFLQNDVDIETFVLNEFTHEIEIKYIFKLDHFELLKIPISEINSTVNDLNSIIKNFYRGEQLSDGAIELLNLSKI